MPNPNVHTYMIPYFVPVTMWDLKDTSAQEPKHTLKKQSKKELLSSVYRQGVMDINIQSKTE